MGEIIFWGQFVTLRDGRVVIDVQKIGPEFFESVQEYRFGTFLFLPTRKTPKKPSLEQLQRLLDESETKPPKSKSLSQILREQLFKKWVNDKHPEDFEDFYAQAMGEIIKQVKDESL